MVWDYASFMFIEDVVRVRRFNVVHGEKSIVELRVHEILFSLWGGIELKNSGVVNPGFERGGGTRMMLEVKFS